MQERGGIAKGLKPYARKGWHRVGGYSDLNFYARPRTLVFVLSFFAISTPVTTARQAIQQLRPWPLCPNTFKELEVEKEVTAAKGNKLNTGNRRKSNTSTFGNCCLLTAPVITYYFPVTVALVYCRFMVGS